MNKLSNLTKKQIEFIDEYMKNGFNGSKAYKTVFKSCKTDGSARALSSKLLTNINIQEEIKRRQDELREKSNIKKEDILNDLRILKDYKITDYLKITKKKRLVNKIDEETKEKFQVEEEYDCIEYKSTDELTDEQIKCIKSIEMTKTGIKYTFYEKDKSIDMINRMLGFYDNTIDINNTINTDFLKNKSMEELIKLIEED